MTNQPDHSPSRLLQRRDVLDNSQIARRSLAAMTAISIKDGRQATRVWNLFGTFQKAVNTLGLRTSRKSSSFQ
jgi:hypothetical protein